MEEKIIDYVKLREQIEYYFSDLNLVNDSFFHNAITTNPEGYVPLTVFLKCNRIIQLGADLDALRIAISDSSFLEMSEDKEKVRRKNGTPPPPLCSNNTFIMWEEKIAPPEATIFYPCIYSFVLKAGALSSTQEVRRALSRAFSFKIPFVRNNRQTGEMVCEVHNAEEVNKHLGSPFRVGRWRLIFSILEGVEKKEWIEKHQGEVNAVIGNSKNKSEKSIGPVRVGGRLFARMDQLKDYLKLVINRTRDGDQIDGEALEVVREIVTYHEDPERSKGVVGIVVDRHPNFKASRCFFVVREDGSRQDFSFHKCLNKLPQVTE